MTLRSLLKIGWSHRCDSISEPSMLFHFSIFMSLPNCVCSSLSILSTNGISSVSRKRLLPLKMLPHVLQKYMKSHQLGPEPLILQWAMRLITQMPRIIPSNSLKTPLIWWMVTRTSLETTPDWRPPQVLSSQGPVQVSAFHSGQHPAGPELRATDTAVWQGAPSPSSHFPWRKTLSFFWLSSERVGVLLTSCFQRTQTRAARKKSRASIFHQ